MLQAGMNVARLNFSHGDHAYHLETLINLREAVKIRVDAGHNCHCAVLLDTKGPEIRTGLLKELSVTLVTGQELEITTDYTVIGDNSIIACSYLELCESVQVGGTILIADGSITCVVKSIGSNSIIVRVENTCVLEERKNMNLPGVVIRLPGITEKDKYDIEHFAVKYDVDIVSGSFIRTAANVQAIRDCLKGRPIRVHAKIESVEALCNIDEIISAADGVHVSRGDLGMELSLSKLFLAQKAVIHLANLAGKPVVTSTQMLESMTKRPRPTNAECSDVANAILDGSDCLMLSGETAKGLYPVESIQTMSRIMSEAERVIDYDGHFQSIRNRVLLRSKNVSIMEALASSAVETSMDLDAPLIVVFSYTGQLARLVAKYRPLSRIMVITSNASTARQMSVSRGVLPKLYVDNDFGPIVEYAKQRGWVLEGERVVRVGSLLDLDPAIPLDLENMSNYADIVIVD